MLGLKPFGLKLLGLTLFELMFPPFDWGGYEVGPVEFGMFVDEPGEIGNRFPGPALIPMREAARAASSAILDVALGGQALFCGANGCELNCEPTGFGLMLGSNPVGCEVDGGKSGIASSGELLKTRVPFEGNC